MPFGQTRPGTASDQSNRVASTAEAKSSVAAIQVIEQKLAEAQAKLNAPLDPALTNAPAVISLEEIATRRALLQRLVGLIEHQLSIMPELETTRKRREEAARQAQAWTRFSEPQPYSMLLVDSLREAIQSENLRIKSLEAALAAIQQLTEENRMAARQAEGKIRQIQESLENAAPGATTRLLWQRDLERLQSQVAAAGVSVLDTERQLRQESLAASRIQLGLLKRKLVMAEAAATFTQADLDKATARIDSESQRLERELAEAELRSRNAPGALQMAREALSRIQSGAEASPAERLRAAEQVSLRETQLETAQTAVRILRLLLESYHLERAMWEIRYTAYHRRTLEVLHESERRLRGVSRRADLWTDFLRQQMAVFPAQIEAQETLLRDLPPDSELIPLVRDGLAALRERDQLSLRLLRRIEQIQRQGERWVEWVRVAEDRLPLFARVQNLGMDAGSLFRRLWNFELFTAEDTIEVEGQKITGRRSVTFGKIAMAILILGVGIWLTGLISRVAEPVIIRRFKIEANQAKLIRRWFRAFMLVCLAMFSLVSVRIPLTVFAFAGGALAIGLGFGMQTLLKNFVSGLILLFERPFRVGDVLEIGSQRGTVTEIGLRSSVLQLWDGTETLIPNSSLLENNVSNWTYSNRKVRFSVTVGAAYGSDIRRIMQILRDVAERHGVVEKEPKPLVLFTDFGDSALMFELRYWVDVLSTNAGLVASDLRQMIAGAFAEHGIVIAFPQRELHVDTVRPLAVEIVPPATGQRSTPGAGAERDSSGGKPQSDRTQP